MARRKSFLDRMLGGESQQARDQRERESRNVEAHVLRQAQRRADLERLRVKDDQARTDQEQAQARLAADLRDQNECLEFHLRRLTDVLRDREQGLATTSEMHAAAFRHRGAAAFVQAVQDGLCASPYPPSLPARTTVLGYRPDARELIIERELPRVSVVPPEQEYRVVKGRILPVPRNPAEVRHLYGQLLARIALRTIAEAFALTPPGLVASVVLDGRVTAVDQATGRPTHPHLLSVQFDREAFEEIHLDAPALDPELCLRGNNAQISPHPYDLVPVTPLLHHDLERHDTIADRDLLMDLDNRRDLLGLHRDEFESLVRRLFEASGLRAWQTQASRKNGVDAVAVNEDPVLGGVVVIQANRYSGVVPPEAVRALAGVMADRHATKGILLTTSWVGRETIEYARRNGRIQIIEGRELKQMLAATLNMNVLISLPTLPQGWERAQVA
jgi:restriction system protein